MFLQLQGDQYLKVAQALRDGEVQDLPVTQAERLLLEFVGTLTRHAYRITHEQVRGLREAGWTDAQIAKAVYDAAFFNMLVRIADAFDIHPPSAWEPGGRPAALTTP